MDVKLALNLAVLSQADSWVPDGVWSLVLMQEGSLFYSVCCGSWPGRIDHPFREWASFQTQGPTCQFLAL